MFFVLKRQLVFLPGSDAFLEIRMAGELVLFISANLDLCPITNEITVSVLPQDHGFFAAAMADGINLCQAIGPGKLILATFE